MEDEGSYHAMLDALKQRAKQERDREVDLANQKYEKRIEALEQVEILFAGNGLSVSVSHQIEAVAQELTKCPEPQRQAVVQVLPIADSLIGRVEALFKQDKQTPWTVNSIEARLEAGGFNFKAENPKASIKTALGRLVERQIIHIVKPGSGRRPNLYKLLPFENGLAMQSENEMKA